MPVGIPLPATLPQVPKKDSYQTTAQANKVVSQSEVGEAKTRLRGTARGKPLVCVFSYTLEQVQIFEDWFENELSDGTIRMTWMDPMRGDGADWKFDDQTPYSVSAQQNSIDYDMTWHLTRLP